MITQQMRKLIEAEARAQDSIDDHARDGKKRSQSAQKHLFKAGQWQVHVVRRRGSKVFATTKTATVVITPHAMPQ